MEGKGTFSLLCAAVQRTLILLKTVKNATAAGNTTHISDNREVSETGIGHEEWPNVWVGPEVEVLKGIKKRMFDTSNCAGFTVET